MPLSPALRAPLTRAQIGSIEGLSVLNHETYAYASSKAALHHLSRLLAGRLGWEGITSNTIACGAFRSKSKYNPCHSTLHILIAPQVTAYLLDHIEKRMVAGTPLSRIGKPEDVGGTAVFLASPAASWMTGATLTLDGGSIVAMPAMRHLAKL